MIKNPAGRGIFQVSCINCGLTSGGHVRYNSNAAIDYRRGDSNLLKQKTPTIGWRVANNAARRKISTLLFQ
jgi:hypothetical protein